MSPGARRVTFLLGAAQTLAWASSYYLPAILAAPIARDLGVSGALVFGAFSASLLLSAVLGPGIGRRIDRVGGRGVLAVSSLVFASGLALLGLARSPAMLAVAFLCLGAGMSLGLYDSAFATLGRIYGAGARPAITGITLMAGFASTIGWPLTAWGLAHFGWRETCFGWAAAHLLLGFPLNGLGLPSVAPVARVAGAGKPRVPFDRNMTLLSVAYALAWMVTGAMAAHLPRLLEATGATAAQAIAAGALIGPAQVVARAAEAGLLSRVHPLLSARLATIGHPLGALALGVYGGGLAASVFAVLHGLGMGVLTVARGTVPLAIFGPENYGYRLGLLGAPARIGQSVAPLLFGVLIDAWAGGALLVSGAMCGAALVALMLVRATPTAAAR